MDITQARPGSGWIEVIAGSMFSGKSEELIRRLRRAQIARRKVQIFKPTVDSRYAKDHIISHSEMRIASETCRHRVSCSSACSPTRKWWVSTKRSSSMPNCRPCAMRWRTRANASSLPARPGLPGQAVRTHSPTPRDRRVHHKDAGHLRGARVTSESTQRLVASSERVLVGAQGTYEARCRNCFDPRLGQ